MPWPCLEEHAQAQRILPNAKSILTSTDVIVGNTLLNVLEQLLHKIKANRRREIGSFYKSRLVEICRRRVGLKACRSIFVFVFYAKVLHIRNDTSFLNLQFILATRNILASNIVLRIRGNLLYADGKQITDDTVPTRKVPIILVSRNLVRTKILHLFHPTDVRRHRR